MSLVFIFSIVVVLALLAVAWIFYQQIFQHPLGKGEEIRGVESVSGQAIELDAVASDVGSND